MITSFQEQRQKRVLMWLCKDWLAPQKSMSFVGVLEPCDLLCGNQTRKAPVMCYEESPGTMGGDEHY